MVLVAVVVLTGGAIQGDTPQFLVGESVAADLEALAEETWDRFLDQFWARRDCFGDVRLEAVYDLDTRAGYDPDSATATVRVPGTAAMLQSGLIHEWAHHVEYQCPEHETLRPAFLSAQGLPPDTPWSPAGATADATGDEWASIPSEQYAETTVEVVLGGRPIPTVARVSPAAIRAVEDWAADRLTETATVSRGE